MKSRIEWQDTGSPFGHMQRVAAHGQYARMQRAYQAYHKHVGDCSTCGVDSTVCTTAEELWTVYQEARS